MAFKKQIFGEGTEQFTHQFFEIEQDECSVVGDALVAKQSRFVEDLLPNYQSEADRDKFVKKFCTKQHQARTVAEAFNRRLDELNSLDPTTPRISFLDTSVYYLYGKNKESCAVLVEDMLVGKFQKWNGNNGFVRKRKNKWLIDRNGVPSGKRPFLSPLDGIAENEEDGTADQKCYEVSMRREMDDFYDTSTDCSATKIFVTPDEVAQAFSHYSYQYSGHKILICDLQGVYDDQLRLFRLTDPVIHYYSPHKPDKKKVYGRTDRGRKGMDDFFESHVCNALCHVVTRGFKNARESKRPKVTITIDD